ncbi:endoplasmic reticulum membrane sensor NFE2L1-like [Watersipora subatra]|uniref:endoplasmic reticulum membrane sensor NFE2L1-like n=1 Tax=Watersipora subatra TaxID=2589382 RepID=UPI00355C8C5F
MRARWKSRLSDGFVQLAVILSLLRTDLRIYLRQYSAYPEVQQALLGQSVGLRLVDTYHSNDQLPLPSSKYTIDDNYLVFNELQRLVGTTGQFYRSIADSVTTWLVTNNTSSLPTSTFAATSARPQQELSTQDVELIEALWKQDVESLVERPQFIFNNKEQENSTSATESVGSIQDSINLASLEDSPSSSFLPWTTSARNGYLNVESRPTYNTQSSLETALQDLLPGNDDHMPEDTVLEDSMPLLEDSVSENAMPDTRATNSSFLYPDGYPALTPDFDYPRNEMNNSGLFWANQGLSLQSQLDSGNIENITADENDMLLSQLEAIDDMDYLPEMDFDLDTNNMLSYLGNAEDQDDISIDSAVGSSPPRSWYNESSSRSERHSISSAEPLELEYGAVGYTKTEPYDDYYEPERKHFPTHDTSVVSHDHTYGAPPGGVPHVRKMDMKTRKEPSRGLAHDQMLCNKFSIPFNVETIIDSPVEAFNSLLQEHKLSAKQISLVRDIRRRGKNKVAAQNCRQKRVGEYSELEVEVEKLRSTRESLALKHAAILNKHTRTKKEIDIMSTEIFHTLRDENGIPYDTSIFSLEVGRNGNIQVTAARTRRSRTSKKRDSKKRRS